MYGEEDYTQIHLQWAKCVSMYFFCAESLYNGKVAIKLIGGEKVKKDYSFYLHLQILQKEGKIKEIALVNDKKLPENLYLTTF